MYRSPQPRGVHSRARLHIAAPLACALLTLVAAVPAFAQPAAVENGASPAANFVSANIRKGLAILGDHSTADEARRAQFRGFLTSLIDARTMALFALGPARRAATPEQIDAYVDAFRDYIVALYASKLETRGSQYLRVMGTSQQSPGDYIVRTSLIDPVRRAGQQDEPLEVDFRINETGGRLAIVDASIAGVWLSVEERDQFANFLQQNVGNLDGLTLHLKTLTERQRSGGSRTSEEG